MRGMVSFRHVQLATMPAKCLLSAGHFSGMERDLVYGFTSQWQYGVLHQTSIKGHGI